MAKAKKENSNLQWYFRWLNNCWKYRLAVTGIVAAIIAMWFWRFWLQSNDELSGIWYKKFIEENLWINILIFVYTVYTATIWGYYSCRFRKRWYHLFFYGITIGTLWVVPALEPVNTPIASISYHVWATIVMGLMALMEICFMLFHSESDTQTNDSNGFLAHIEEERHQDTGWSKYVDTLLRMIGSAQMQQDSFTIGITGSWGSGKTTFYKLIRKKLKEEGKFGICEFQPWQVVNYTQLSSQFFVTFKQYLINQGVLPESDLISNISKYAGVLESIPEVSSFAKPIINAIQAHEDSTLQTLHDQIGDILAEKKFLTAVIDDLDRLNQNELMEVLRLIRVSANFRNVLFVVTYDKDHISKVMREHGKEYLKKIVNVEINLPPIENYKYMNLLLGNISRIVPSLSQDQLEELKDAFRTQDENTKNTLLNKYSHNFRDLLRFSNHFGLVLTHLKSMNLLTEYNLFDLFWLEMLRYFDEDTYYQLQEHPLQLLIEKKNFNTKQAYLQLKNPKQQGIKSTAILTVLFDENRTNYDDTIIWRNNFNNYFARRFLDNAVSMTEFSTLMEGSTSSAYLRSQILKWSTGHQRKSFEQVVQNYPHNNVFQSELAVKNYARVLFELYSCNTITKERLKELFHAKCRKSYFEKVSIKDLQQILKRAMFMHPSESWNNLLTAMCVTKGDPQYMSIGRNKNDEPYILSYAQLEGLAVLNYTRRFLSKNCPLEDLFKPNNEYTNFMLSLQYIAQAEGPNNENVKFYNNLLGAYILSMYSEERGRRTFSNETFSAMFNNLIVLSKESDNIEVQAKHIHKKLQQTVGSAENFERFVRDNFKLDDLNVAICDGYNLKHLRKDNK